MIHEYDLSEYVDTGRCTPRKRRTLSDLTAEELDQILGKSRRRMVTRRQSRLITAGLICSGCLGRPCICDGEQLALLTEGRRC